MKHRSLTNSLRNNKFIYFYYAIESDFTELDEDNWNTIVKLLE